MRRVQDRIFNESDMIGAMTAAEDCDWWNMLAGFFEFGYLIE